MTQVVPFVSVRLKLTAGMQAGLCLASGLQHGSPAGDRRRCRPRKVVTTATPLAASHRSPAQVARQSSESARRSHQGGGIACAGPGPRDVFGARAGSLAVTEITLLGPRIRAQDLSLVLFVPRLSLAQ
jgi:hypothetical protein